MAYEWAKPGVKCVCVDAALSRPEWLNPHAMYDGDLSGLTKGEIYTIRRTQDNPLTGRLDIVVMEINRGSYSRVDPTEAGFDASRFRPPHHSLSRARQRDVP